MTGLFLFLTLLWFVFGLIVLDYEIFGDKPINLKQLCVICMVGGPMLFMLGLMDWIPTIWPKTNFIKAWFDRLGDKS